jgi:hypothetical protein
MVDRYQDNPIMNMTFEYALSIIEKLLVGLEPIMKVLNKIITTSKTKSYTTLAHLRISTLAN